MTDYSSKARRHRLRRTRKYRWSVLSVVLGTLLLAGAGIASAAILLHGRGTLTAPAYREQTLQVSAVGLSRPLLPGGSADLRFRVRNPNAFPVAVAGVTVSGKLLQATPAGCLARLAGPLTQAAGFRFPATSQPVIAANGQRDLVAVRAFTLNSSATSGCGFVATLDVTAVQQPTTAGHDPAPTAPTSRSASAPSSGPPTGQVLTPPTPVDQACDPADPDCPTE